MKRKIDDLGRVVLPQPFRKEIGIENGSSLNIELEEQKIIITNPEQPDYKAILEEATKYVEELIDSDNSKYFESYDIETSRKEELLGILKGGIND